MFSTLAYPSFFGLDDQVVVLQSQSDDIPVSIFASVISRWSVLRIAVQWNVFHYFGFAYVPVTVYPVD